MTKLMVDEAQKILKASLEKIAGRRCALMFSGGFDSLLMALLMQRYGVRVIAVTVKFDDFNLRTVAEATVLARRMNLAQHILHVTLPEFLSAFGALPSLIDKPILDLDLALVHAAFKKYDPKISGKIFVSGMGSDQWFGDKASEQDVIDEGAHYKIAKAHGYRFIFPFLSKQMRVLSQQLPAASKKNKKLLREMIPNDCRGLIPGCRDRSEIQVPAQVRRLLVRTFSDGKSVKADDKTLRQMIEHFWLKKNAIGLKKQA